MFERERKGKRERQKNKRVRESKRETKMLYLSLT